MEDLRELCKMENVSSKSYCMWFQLSNNSDWLDECEIGEWFWSNSISKISKLFTEYLVGEIIKMSFDFEELVDKGLIEENPVDDDEEHESKYYIDLASLLLKKKIHVFDKLKERISVKPKTFEELNDMIIDVVKIFNRLHIDLSITLVKGFSNCIPLIKAHGNYDDEATNLELISNDSLC